MSAVYTADTDIYGKVVEMKLLVTSFVGTGWLYDIGSGVVSPSKNRYKDADPEKPMCAINPVYSVSHSDIEEAVSRERQALVLNITEECSNRCKYCVYGGAYSFERPHSQRSLPLEKAIAAVDQFLDSGIPGKQSISFYGGEPTIPSGMKTIRSVVEHIKQKTCRPVKYTFTTNGNHLTEENIKFLVENDFRIMVSLDGPREVHDRYRRTIADKPTFDTVMEGLRRIKSYAPAYYDEKVGFICVLTPPLDYELLSDFWGTNELLAGHPLMVSNVSLFGQKIFNDDDVESFSRDTIEMMRNVAQKYYQRLLEGDLKGCTFERGVMGKDLAILHERQTSVDSSEPDLMGRCIPGGRKCYVDTDGRYYACEKLQGGYSIGSTEEGCSLEKIEKLIRDYDKLVVRKCRNCPYAKVCSLCYISAYDEERRFSAERLETNCTERRSYAKLLIRLYVSLWEKLGFDRMEELFGT